MSTEYGINENTVRQDVHHIVYSSDLRKITQRSVFQRISDKYGVSLSEFKPLIYERAVEEARLRIQSSPELQRQQQMSNTKYYYHGDVNTQQQRKYFNTIYNTPNSYHLSTANSSDQSQQLQNNKNKNKRKKKQQIINYQDVKKHYIGTTNKSHRNRIIQRPLSSSSGDDDNDEEDDDDDDDGDVDGYRMNEPPTKKRRYGMDHHELLSSPKKTAQSKRESDKDTEYEFSDAFKTMMGKQRGTWRECWQWIENYTKQNDLRIGTRKIRCDHVLKQAFHREESSVSGVSRLIWKHLIGAVELDENGNFKKLIYKKRKSKYGDGNHDDNDNDDDNDDDKHDEEDSSNEEEETENIHYVNHIDNLNHNHNHNHNQKPAEPVRQKRRYRKRLRDENGNIIKKRKRSGLTRLCFMSEALKAIVGKQGPLARNKITKGFWDYTEANGLKKKGRIIVCDDKLKKIWGENTEQIHMYSVQKGLKEHITTMNKDEEKRYKEENPHLFMDEMEEKEKVKK